SLGQFAWNTYDPTSEPTSEIKDYNELFNRLSNNDDFMNDCKIRWFELRKQIWSEEAILDLLQELYEEIQDILENEVEMWNPGDYIKKWNNDVDVSVKNLFSWISERLDYCDFYFSNFSTNPLKDTTYSQ
ncbi:MAG TPA: CotH kinase family protein, partial [Candidatus Lokiarchaeia archaeon]